MYFILHLDPILINAYPENDKSQGDKKNEKKGDNNDEYGSYYDYDYENEEDDIDTEDEKEEYEGYEDKDYDKDDYDEDEDNTMMSCGTVRPTH